MASVSVTVGDGAVINFDEGPFHVTERHFSAMRDSAAKLIGESDVEKIACYLANWYANGAIEMAAALRSPEVTQ